MMLLLNYLAIAKRLKQISSIIPIEHYFKNKNVKGKKISVSSYFDYNIDFFFSQELIKKNTLEIVKPLTSIQFIEQNLDSDLWKEGFTYELLVKPFGLTTIWGTHYLTVDKIDHEGTRIITIEKK